MDMETINDAYEWSEWRPFPDPRHNDYLRAPFGCGVYQLRMGKEYIMFGSGANLASRMCSLLPAPYGCGTRKNDDKRRYALSHIKNIKYRTVACKTREEAHQIEKELKSLKIHLFNT